MEDRRNYAYRLRAISAYRSFLQLPPIQALQTLIDELAKECPDAAVVTTQYADIFYQLQLAGYDSLGAYLWEHFRYDETPYGDAASKGKANHALILAAKNDIQTFSMFAAMDGDMWKTLLQNYIGKECADCLPEWNAERTLTFEAVTDEYVKHGAGKFARYKAFLWENKILLPIEDPDLEEYDLIGYEEERKEVEDNTRALLAGYSVNNMLLYGAAGTGKSATIKSLLKVPGFEDLRIIEVDKQQLQDIPALIRSLADLRQKFIIFIDDLSFETADVGYSVLKTVLEGSIEKRPANVAIYATSNRRHLMRETFSERGDDEINVRESIEERTALAERFGIRVLFRGLNKTQYLEMVQTLAKQVSLDISAEELKKRAVQWEREHASRTPRSAQQFIKYLQGL